MKESSRPERDSPAPAPPPAPARPGFTAAVLGGIGAAILATITAALLLTGLLSAFLPHVIPSPGSELESVVMWQRIFAVVLAVEAAVASAVVALLFRPALGVRNVLMIAPAVGTLGTLLGASPALGINLLAVPLAAAGGAVSALATTRPTRAAYGAGALLLVLFAIVASTSPMVVDRLPARWSEAYRQAAETDAERHRKN